MNKIWHAVTWSTVENRLTTMVRPAILRVAAISRRVWSNGAEPKMPITNGSSLPRNASAGHST